MTRLKKHNRRIVIVLAILFLLMRVMGLHAHGHMEVAHEHTAPAAVAYHDHGEDKSHLISYLDHLQDFYDPQHGHSESAFEIEHQFVVKKQKNSFDTSLVFVLALVLVLCLLPRALKVRPSPDTHNTRSKTTLYFNQAPLRAPPLAA